jgi:hypothetical protein
MQTLKSHPAQFGCALFVFTLLTISPTLATGQDNGGKVLPAHTTPYGFSLDAMASAMALFQTSSQLADYPITPFQILYCCGTAQFSNPICPDGGQGTLEVASNSFSVSAGTAFYVPLFSFDDTPPVLGVFPDKSTVGNYIFGFDQYGATGTEIIVDGKATPIGPEFLGGPVEGPAFAPAGWIDGVFLTPGVHLLDAPPASVCQPITPPIPGCGTAGTHFVQLGPFLSPMRVGTHTVEIKGQVGNSSLFVQAFSPFFGHCLQEDITYTVKVLPILEAE